MIKFSYDNIEVYKLTLEFKCKCCQSQVKTKKLDVPMLDLDNFAPTKQSYHHTCTCGETYSIDIFNGVYESYGIINEIEGTEKDIFVYNVPDILCDKNTIFVDTISSYVRIESIINNINTMSSENKNYIFNLLFSNLISILDSFIKIYTAPMILYNNDLIEKFSNAFEMKGTIEEKKEKIMYFYDRRSFQSVSNQRKLFEEVFNISIDIDKRIDQYVAIRNVIIHRNSIDKEGFIYNIKKSQLLQALEVIKDYTHHMNRALTDYEMDQIVDN